MIASIIIRRCRPDECALVLDAWKEAGTMTSVTDTVEVLQRLLGTPATTLLVAEDGGKLVGSIIAAYDGWRGNFYRLAVLPAYRRQGLARRLVKEGEGFLVSQGAQRIGGLVAKDRREAVSFWSALGESEYERDESFVRYVKTL